MEEENVKAVIIERRLSIIYLICAALSIIGLVTSAVVFGYWHDTLNMCYTSEEFVYRNCGCILYASSTYRIFVGGETIICHFVQYSNIPGIIIGLLLGFIHWYRSTFTLRKKQKPARSGRVQIARPRNKCEIASWIICSILLILQSILVITAAVILSDGTRKACQEYRHNLIETIHASGHMAELINDRLLCPAIFSFMDYLLPTKYRYSTSFINTGAALFIDNFAMWFAAAGFLLATIISIYKIFFPKNNPPTTRQS